MTYLEVMPSLIPFRLDLEKFRLREIKASVEDVVGEDEVSAKTASLERKKYSVDEVVLHIAVPSCL